ncbi:putative PAS sensor signal transduction histidine kinase [Methanocella conradii HZ254]|uniref:histidine kinase n=1 Tax=Methanocella conradii (strain DSM 24694 / JCM 17849 / CGMCC 1.5162 / HZ254) TaxID=1041930 RepID=H8I698_METCZ|nr:PAS domain-containing sensor histidine kinase [Methanocella conradii]AFD00745.1 putative PAS sensor signal transduction histidine kinase [Methanocella conradii HZ254]
MAQSISTFRQGAQNKALLAFIILACIVITLYVNAVMGIDVVYTHLFYIPIILAGVWYHRKAVFIALFLGLSHVAIGYYLAGRIIPDTFIRAGIFIIVALVVGYLSEKRDKLYDSVRLLLESTDEGIYGVDGQGRCTLINRSALKMLGYSMEEVIGKNVHDLIHHTKRDGKPRIREECCVARTLATGVGYRDSDDVFWRKDGTTFPVEYSSNPVTVDSSVTGAVVTFIDISERKRAEEEIEEAKRQAELYIDLMGHDINNMNQMGIGYLELAMDRLKLSGEDRQYLLKPLEALYDSSRLIDTVRKLQLAKEGAVKREKVDACRILHEVISQYSHVPGRDVTIQFSPPGPCYVMADDLLKDVFSNIIGNAIKHSRGAVAVEAKVSHVLEGSQTLYRFDISDNGPGIPDDVKKKLFTRYQRGDFGAAGHGLGLYLVKALVDDFHGKVWVEDRVPGDYTKGCRFVVMLPALTSSPSSQSQAR